MMSESVHDGLAYVVSHKRLHHACHLHMDSSLELAGGTQDPTLTRYYCMRERRASVDEGVTPTNSAACAAALAYWKPFVGNAWEVQVGGGAGCATVRGLKICLQHSARS